MGLPIKIKGPSIDFIGTAIKIHASPIDIIGSEGAFEPSRGRTVAARERDGGTTGRLLPV
jgi:hypothetical protein